MVDWPADKVERRDITALIPYARNARMHSDEQIAQICASIREWGWTIPVLIDEEGEIIAGHGRVMAASRLGITEVPVIVARDWTKAQKKAYRLADNRLSEASRWDYQLLRLELGDLAGFDFDLPTIGFSAQDLDAFLSGGLKGNPVADPKGEWQGMPEFEQADKEAYRTLHVHFKDQEAVDAFAELVAQPITDRTRMLWFPHIEIETYADKRYAVSLDDT